MIDNATDPFALATAAAAKIAELTGVPAHDIALVLGSGWGEAANLIGETTHRIPATDLPGFHAAAVPGHVGTISSVLTSDNKRVLVLGARTHFYEGKGVRAVVHGVRTAAAAGAKTLVLTNGCGGLNPAWTPGTPVLISDHINLTAASPLEGATFVDLTDLYSPRMRGLAREVDPTLDEGVYAQFTGPHYETPAEVRYAKAIGADLVGMSTALEAIAARHAGMEVFGISLVTNLAAGISATALSHEEVIEAGAGRRPAHLRAAGRHRRQALAGPAPGGRGAQRRAPAHPDRIASDFLHSPIRPKDPPMSQNLHHTELLDRAAAWADQDPDAQTQAQLRGLCWRVRAGEAEALEELEDRFAGNLAFGTAGLRAELGAGPNRMNSMVVRRTAAGIGRFLIERAAGSYVPGAVVGFDARHNSDKFARESAAILTAAGVRVSLMPLPLPTPVLAWAVRELDAEAGIMVTASHNPPADNGYKVYLGGRVESGWGRGAQIVTPTDAQIAALIDHDEPIGAIALAESGWDVLPGRGEAGDIEAAYLAKVTALLTAPGGETTADLDAARAGPEDRADPDARGRRAHHVPGLRVRRLHPGLDRARAGTPGPGIPHRRVPQPGGTRRHRPGRGLAKETGADLVIANDPDADRCAAAVEFPGTGWRMLRGDEVGWLLGARLAPAADPDSVFANSIVSSRMLASIAAASGLKHEQTLTGFKWISRAPHLAFGYEEALGYCVAPELVRDKDGISAALLLAEYAAELKAAGSGFPQVLDQLALAHGLHQTDQLSVRVKDLGLLDTMMDALRATPPQSLAGEAIVEFEDLGLGAHLPPTDGLLFLTDAGTRVIVRPSGTEPKLKCYLEVIAPVADADDLPGPAHGRPGPAGCPSSTNFC